MLLHPGPFALGQDTTQAQQVENSQQQKTESILLASRIKHK